MWVAYLLKWEVVQTIILEYWKIFDNIAENMKMRLVCQKEKTLKTSDKLVKFVEIVPRKSGIIGKILRKKVHC